MFSDDYDNNRLTLGVSVFILEITKIMANDKNLSCYWLVIVLHLSLLKNRSNRYMALWK